jgi:vacuolar protein sorting-associated protein 45
LQRIRKLIGNSKVRDIDAGRLVMLYALRYEKHANNDIVGLVEALKHRGVPEHLTKVSRNINYILRSIAVHVILRSVH